MHRRGEVPAEVDSEGPDSEALDDGAGPGNRGRSKAHSRIPQKSLRNRASPSASRATKMDPEAGAVPEVVCESGQVRSEARAPGRIDRAGAPPSAGAGFPGMNPRRKAGIANGFERHGRHRTGGRPRGRITQATVPLPLQWLGSRCARGMRRAPPEGSAEAHRLQRSVTHVRQPEKRSGPRPRSPAARRATEDPYHRSPGSLRRSPGATPRSLGGVFLLRRHLGQTLDLWSSISRPRRSSRCRTGRGATSMSYSMRVCRGVRVHEEASGMQLDGVALLEELLADVGLPTRTCCFDVRAGSSTARP